jgi:hypothetical protein
MTSQHKRDYGVPAAKTTFCNACRCPRTSHSIKGCLNCMNCTVKYTDKDMFS